MKKNYIFKLALLLFALCTNAQTQVVSGLNNPRGLAVNGNDIYIADITNNRVVKFDATASTPTLVEVITGLNLPRELAFDGNTLYISESNKISMVDISNTSLPLTPVTFYGPLDNPQGMLINGNDFYFTSGGNLLKLDLMDVTGDPDIVVSGANITDFVISGNNLYIGRLNGIDKIDVTSPLPATPEEIVSIPAGFAIGMTLANDILYVAENNGQRVSSLNITDATPTLTSVVGINSPSDVTFFNNALFISDTDTDSIFKFDLSASELFQGLAHFYRLDTNTVTDEITNTNALVSSSQLVSNGVVNGSHEFNNTDNISLLDFSPNSFTINVWFRSNDDQKVQRIFHRGGVGGSVANRFSYSLVYIPNQGLRFSTADQNASATQILVSGFNDVNNWHMITCSFDSGSRILKIYLDGNLSQTATAAQSYFKFPSQSILEFSRYSAGIPQSINGNLDEIGLWTRALTDAQVTELFQQQGTLSVNEVKPENNLILYPNPVVDYLEIKGLQSPQPYEVYSISGTKIISGILSNNRPVDVRPLSKGVYLLKIGEKGTYKFIK